MFTTPPFLWLAHISVAIIYGSSTAVQQCNYETNEKYYVEVPVPYV
jgi:hypothetical protein